MRPGEPVRFDSRCLLPSADALTGSPSTNFRELLCCRYSNPRELRNQIGELMLHL